MPLSLRRRASTGALLALALLATGCAFPSTDTPVEASQVDAPSVDPALVAVVQESQSQIPGLIDSFDGVYSDIRIMAEAPSTLVYEYDYTDTIDPDMAVTHFEDQRGALNDACATQIYPGLFGAGVDNPLVRYAYFNADGTELWSMTCDPA